MIVEKTWKSTQRGINMYKLMTKLKSVKFEVKDWSKMHIGNAYDKLSINAQKIDYVEQTLLSSTDSYRFNS